MRVLRAVTDDSPGFGKTGPAFRGLTMEDLALRLYPYCVGG